MATNADAVIWKTKFNSDVWSAEVPKVSADQPQRFLQSLFHQRWIPRSKHITWEMFFWPTFLFKKFLSKTRYIFAWSHTKNKLWLSLTPCIDSARQKIIKERNMRNDGKDWREEKTCKSMLFKLIFLPSQPWKFPGTSNELFHYSLPNFDVEKGSLSDGSKKGLK